MPRNLKPIEGLPTPKDPDERAALATYIAAMSGDLALMARRAKLDTLGYLLEMARLEAENTAQKGTGA